MDGERRLALLNSSVREIQASPSKCCTHAFATGNKAEANAVRALTGREHPTTAPNHQIIDPRLSEKCAESFMQGRVSGETLTIRRSWQRMSLLRNATEKARKREAHTSNSVARCLHLVQRSTQAKQNTMIDGSKS